MRNSFGAALLAAVGTTTQPAAALDAGHWLVAGSFRMSNAADYQSAALAQASAAVRRCGFRPFNDHSEKFMFAEGFDVVVTGPYRSRAEADTNLGRLRKCVPEAYVKYGRYLGE